MRVKFDVGCALRECRCGSLVSACDSSSADDDDEPLALANLPQDKLAEAFQERQIDVIRSDDRPPECNDMELFLRPSYHLRLL